MSRAAGLRWLLVVSACWMVGFALFYPSALTVRDEVNYVQLAENFSQGVPCTDVTDPVTGETTCRGRGQYLPGTAALMAPFVALAGWRGAFLLGALSLLVCAWATAAWIRAAGHHPGFALYVFAFPAALVLGRVSMSDVPSAALVAVGLWLFWTGDRGPPTRWLLCGFIAGYSTIVREPNPLAFAPFFLGALLRRERSVWALVVGGLAGVALRPLSTWFVFGDPFYVFPFSHEFGPRSALATLPIHLPALLVLVPGGLVGGLAYRGPRRPEAIATVLAFVTLYVTAGYGGAESGSVRGFLLATRYYIPLVPILAFLSAESLPRLARGLPRPALTAAIRVWAVALAIGAFAVHPAFAWWGRQQADLRQTIYATTPEASVVVFDHTSSSKFVNRLFGDRQLVHLLDFGPRDAERIFQRHDAFYVALVDRSDSPFWIGRAEENADRLDALRGVTRFELLHDGKPAPTERLRIWRVTPLEPSRAAAGGGASAQAPPGRE